MLRMKRVDLEESLEIIVRKNVNRLERTNIKNNDAKV
jgi:hypothetical protein